ncbi:MAG: acetyltransferase [Candidatus Hydrothermae bacterium]|nr:acetyltransferase [Candidatus Hydrothermae bacterium]
MIATAQAAGVPVQGILDDREDLQGQQILGVPVVGRLAEADRFEPRRGVVAIGDNRTRKQVVERLTDWTWVTLVHPRAVVHESVRMGPGTVVFAGAVIQPDTVIGVHVIINTGATVDHDCVIGDFAHIAPGAHLAGGVRVGEGVLLGIGSSVIPGKRIGNWSVVGAGAAVVKDLPPNVVAVGVPAKLV